MPPRLSARAMFRWGTGLIVVAVLVPLVPQVGLGTAFGVGATGLLVSVAVSQLVWVAQVVGAALLAGSLVVRALRDDDRRPGHEGIEAGADAGSRRSDVGPGDTSEPVG